MKYIVMKLGTHGENKGGVKVEINSRRLATKVENAKLSKTFRFNNWLFRYNEKEALLQLIDPEDYTAIDSIELDKDNWQEDNMYCVEKYYNNLQEELRNM